MKILKCLLSTIFLVAIIITAFAQDQDSLKKKEYIQRKNVIRYNLTPSLLGFNSYIVGYERVLWPYQSFSINVGYLALGKNKTKESEKFDLISSKTSGGFSAVLDYRFYLKKENKYKAPHGIYFGPYFASYLLKSGHTLKSNNDNIGNPELKIDLSLANQNLGLELGYQFVIKNRVSIDLILLGPSISTYLFRMQASGSATISDPEVEEALITLKNILVDRYPWVQNLFDDGKIDLKGNKSTWGFGFRYLIQIGYNF